MNKMQRQVLEFYEKFVNESHWLHNLPLHQLSDERKLLRASLLISEVSEKIEAMRNKKPFEVIDGICDCIYILLGTAIEMGIDIEPYFNEVHRSNMTKTKEIDSGGKIKKGEKYEAPDLGMIYRNEPFETLHTLFPFNKEEES